MKRYFTPPVLRPILFLFSILVLTGQVLDVSHSSSSGNAPAPQQRGLPRANIPDDVNQALLAMPQARVEALAKDGIPSFVVGELARIEARPDRVTDKDLLPVLEQITPIFRLRPQDLSISRIEKDELGMVHIRYRQTKNGLGVVGGDLVVHINAEGIVHVVNGTARDGFDISPTPALTARAALSAALGARPGQNVSANQPRLTYLISGQQTMHLTYEITVEGRDSNGHPVRDLVYVDANDGQVVDIHPQICSLLNREVYKVAADKPCVVPGQIVRRENDPVSTDPVVNTVFNHMGGTYNAYFSIFNRDSWNGAGATMISTVHQCGDVGNAFWNGGQAVFSDHAGGSWSDCLDIVGHEFTHGVSIHSGLGTGREAGALNEAWSDIFGAVVEAFNRGGVSANTWKLGEDCMPPGAGEALHFMNNPTQDGVSTDNYDELLSTEPSAPDNGNVHNNAGIANLAFYLLVNGGSHPRIPSGTVPAIGFDGARRVFYRATTAGYLIGSATFVDARIATAQAATDLGFSTSAVHAAWEAVRVGLVRPLDSTFVSQSVPTTMATGESANVSITLRNSGSQTWVASELAQFILLSQNPHLNTTWGNCCFDLPQTVPPNGEVTFNFTITAPPTPGTRNFQWRMLKTGFGLFGSFTNNVAINVVSAPTFNDNAEFVSQSVPTTVDPGQSYVVTVVMRNAGSTVWTAFGGYSLGSQNPSNNATWGVSQVAMPSNIAPGVNANFSFFVTAPNSPGTYNFQWRLKKGLAAFFGSPSANVAVTVNNGPTAPANLTATILSNSEVRLNWADASSNESGFKIERKTGTNGTFTQIATVGANVTTFTNTGLSPLTTYCYRVRAFHANGNSAYTNQVCVTMPDQPPAAPGSMEAMVFSCSVSLGWSDGSNNETGFIVEKRVGSFGPFSELTRTGVDETWAGDEGPFQQYTYYFYRVRAFNAAGVSAPSNAVQVFWSFPPCSENQSTQGNLIHLNIIRDDGKAHTVMLAPGIFKRRLDLALPERFLMRRVES